MHKRDAYSINNDIRYRLPELLGMEARHSCSISSHACIFPLFLSCRNKLRYFALLMSRNSRRITVKVFVMDQEKGKCNN